LGQVRHLSDCRPVAFLAGGKSLLIHQKKGECSVVDTTTFATLIRFPARGNVYASTNAQYLADEEGIGGLTGRIVCHERTWGKEPVSQVVCYDIPSGEVSCSLVLPNVSYHPYEARALSADGSVLAVINNHSSYPTELWDARRGKRLASLIGHGN